MANQTTDRDAPQLLQQPSFRTYGPVDPTATETAYFGQLIQEGGDGFDRPYNTLVSSGSIIKGVCQHAAVSYSPSAPFVDMVMPSKTGTYGFLNDGSNPVLSGTLPNTIVYATDNQSFGLVGGSNRLPGRFRKFVPSDPYPVYVEVGLMPSGSTTRA